MAWLFADVRLRQKNLSFHQFENAIRASNELRMSGLAISHSVADAILKDPELTYNGARTIPDYFNIGSSTPSHLVLNSTNSAGSGISGDSIQRLSL